MGKTSSSVKQRYNKKAYDRVAVTIPKGRKEAVEACANTKGISVNALINNLLMDAVGMSETEWKRKPEGGVPGE